MQHVLSNKQSISTSNLSSSALTETTISSDGIILNELNCFKNPFERGAGLSRELGDNTNRVRQKFVLSMNESSKKQVDGMMKSTVKKKKGVVSRTMSMPSTTTRQNGGGSSSGDQREPSSPSSASSSSSSSRSANELRKSASTLSFTQQSKNSHSGGGGGSGSGSGGRSGSARRVKFVSTDKTAPQRTMSTYGNQYFTGKYDSKYGTHKHLRRHHNKTQRPIRLLDFNSIRYGKRLTWIGQITSFFLNSS